MAVRALAGVFARSNATDRTTVDEAISAEEAWPRVDRGSEGWEELRREITRARRFAREFVLVRVPLPAPVRARVVEPEVATAIASLTALVRSIDRVWVDGDSAYLLLPEANREAGEGFLARVRREAPELVRHARACFAAFPEDGLTSGAMLKALRAGADVRPVADQSAAPVQTPILHASGQ
jgi:hypothetical protein